jgi:hypothetical protein
LGVAFLKKMSWELPVDVWKIILAHVDTETLLMDCVVVSKQFQRAVEALYDLSCPLPLGTSPEEFWLANGGIALVDSGANEYACLALRVLRKNSKLLENVERHIGKALGKPYIPMGLQKSKEYPFFRFGTWSAWMLLFSRLAHFLLTHPNVKVMCDKCDAGVEEEKKNDFAEKNDLAKTLPPKYTKMKRQVKRFGRIAKNWSMCEGAFIAPNGEKVAVVCSGSQEITRYFDSDTGIWDTIEGKTINLLN